MNQKYFLLNPRINKLNKKEIDEIQNGHQFILDKSEIEKRQKNINKITEIDNINNVSGRVIVKINLEYKNYHTFNNGMVIRRERQFNELNRNITEPVNAIVISGEGIIKNSEILVHPNSIHDSNRIFDYKDGNDNIKYYSIHNDMCFGWYDEDNKQWEPISPYDFAMRIFVPYSGLIQGLPPTQLKDTLWVTTGELNGNAVKTIAASDFPIIFNNRNGQEKTIVRFRPFGDKIKQREEEAICILNDVTKKVLSGKYLVGYTTSDAKPLKEYL